MLCPKLCIKYKSFQLNLKRLISKSSQILEKSTKISLKTKRTGKLTVVRRTIGASKDSSSVLEYKVASNVMKRLNWENKNLFGPLLSSKPRIYDRDKIVKSNKIIQHKTVIPIIDPPGEQIISIKSSSDTHYDKKNISDLSTLLTFPLVNKSTSVNINLSNRVTEWNIVRKNLQCLCEISSMPSVSAILEKTMPKERVEILDQWRQNMIKQLGEDGFRKYQNDIFANGTSLHSSINSYLTQVPESELLIKEENIGHWRSLKHVFPNIKDVKLLEEFVTHPFLCYKGVVDCFARYKNYLVVIDWKTSKKSKTTIKNTYDNPLQIAAYVGALNFDPKYQYLVSQGLIVVAYESGMPATVHYIDESSMLMYWKEWLQRVKQFWEIKMSEPECS